MWCAVDMTSADTYTTTVEPLNNGHIWGRDFVPCREVVHYRRLNNTTAICLVPSYVSIIGRLSLARRVLYRRFHCIHGTLKGHSISSFFFLQYTLILLQINSA